MGSFVSIVAVVGVFLGCLLAAIYAWDAWQGIPRELYRLAKPRLGILRPFHFVAVAANIHLVVRMGEWSGYFKVPDMVERLGDVLCLLFLAWWFIWSARVVRQRPTADKNLVRFANYVGGGTGIFIVTILAAIWVSRR